MKLFLTGMVTYCDIKRHLLTQRELASPLTGFDPIKIRVKLRLKPDLAQQRLTMKSRPDMGGGQLAVAHCACSKNVFFYGLYPANNLGSDLKIQIECKGSPSLKTVGSIWALPK